MALDKRRHVFISHHHADDDEVTKLTNMLNRKGYDIRNSSIRAKPANQERLEKGLVSDKVIERMLKWKISWAGTVIVLVGENTHARRWVNWEIEEANRQGKRIIGVYARGGTDAHIPEALDKYASSIVAWNTDSVMSAVDGSRISFQNSDGAERPATMPRQQLKC